MGRRADLRVATPHLNAKELISMHKKMKGKSFSEAKEILRIAAQSYKNNYINKDVLFVASHGNTVHLYEVTFFAKNFMHLTRNIKNMSSKQFYNMWILKI